MRATAADAVHPKSMQQRDEVIRHEVSRELNVVEAAHSTGDGYLSLKRDQGSLDGPARLIPQRTKRADVDVGDRRAVGLQPPPSCARVEARCGRTGPERPAVRSACPERASSRSAGRSAVASSRLSSATFTQFERYVESAAITGRGHRSPELKRSTGGCRRDVQRQAAPPPPPPPRRVGVESDHKRREIHPTECQPEGTPRWP